MKSKKSIRSEKITSLIFILLLFSCSKGETEQLETGQAQWPDDIVIGASGLGYHILDTNVISYCGQGWGRKTDVYLTNFGHKFSYSSFTNSTYTRI